MRLFGDVIERIKAILAHEPFEITDSRARISLLNNELEEVHKSKQDLIAKREENLQDAGLVLTDLFKSEQNSVFTRTSTEKSYYSAVIICNYDDEILFLLRSHADDFHPGTWCLPSGAIEIGEDNVGS